MKEGEWQSQLPEVIPPGETYECTVSGSQVESGKSSTYEAQ